MPVKHYLCLNYLTVLTLIPKMSITLNPDFSVLHIETLSPDFSVCNTLKQSRTETETN